MTVAAVGWLCVFSSPRCSLKLNLVCASCRYTSRAAATPPSIRKRTKSVLGCLQSEFGANARASGPGGVVVGASAASGGDGAAYACAC